MSEVKDCVELNEFKDFCTRDLRRLLEKFNCDPNAEGEEVVLSTDKMHIGITFESLKKGYIDLFKKFRDSNDLSNLKCKDIELIFVPDFLNSQSLMFKFTFVK